MRAPFQILAIPYRKGREGYVYCVFRRADNGQFQFVAGGGEDGAGLGGEIPRGKPLRQEPILVRRRELRRDVAVPARPTAHLLQQKREHLVGDLPHAPLILHVAQRHGVV